MLQPWLLVAGMYWPWNLTELLAPGGVLVVTLRHGPGDDERRFYEVSAQEFELFARQRALISLHVGRDEGSGGKRWYFDCGNDGAGADSL